MKLGKAAMGNIPPPPPREWVEITCLEDTHRRFVRGSEVRYEPWDPVPPELVVEAELHRWRIERNDRISRETLQENARGAALLLALLAGVIAAVVQ